MCLEAPQLYLDISCLEEMSCFFFFYIYTDLLNIICHESLKMLKVIFAIFYNLEMKIYLSIAIASKFLTSSMVEGYVPRH